ncbi:uncharacterized protein [Clinocottus analis]|uniref:uncharacterized protein n=1 Tax=Clinocottus analis TaxID=304258 RepID=UPI0035BF194C
MWAHLQPCSCFMLLSGALQRDHPGSQLLFFKPPSNMAEVRLCYGRVAYNFSQKTCSRYLLESRIKQSKSAAQVSSPSAEFIYGDIQSGGPQRADSAASRHNYTTVNSGFRRTVWSARAQQSPALCWAQGQEQVVLIRAYSDYGARSEPLYKTQTGYYEILELSPTATQTQIKTAYYKQSFVYHPDRNADSEAATVRFSEISEAYTVLGNKALRKKYDRGLLSRSDLIATARPSTKDTGSSAREQPAGSRRSVVGADSRDGVFDFDKFYRAHYNEQLQRDRDLRLRKQEMLKKKDETIAEKKMGRMMEIGVVALIVIAFGLMSSFK